MNWYEIPTVVSVGYAHDLILGIKPVMGPMDSEGVVNYAERVDDIDETDK